MWSLKNTRIVVQWIDTDVHNGTAIGVRHVADSGISQGGKSLPVTP